MELLGPGELFVYRGLTIDINLLGSLRKVLDPEFKTTDAVNVRRPSKNPYRTMQTVLKDANAVCVRRKSVRMRRDTAVSMRTHP